MPRTLASISPLIRPSGLAPVALCDILTADGTKYFWSTQSGDFYPSYKNGFRLVNPASTGTSLLKCYTTVAGSSASGLGYRFRFRIRNIGANLVTFHTNVTSFITVSPGEDRLVDVVDTSTGGALQLVIYAETIAAPFNILVDPEQILVRAEPIHQSLGLDRDAQANLFASASKDMVTGWTNSYLGSSVTVTANYQACLRPYDPLLKQAGPIKRSRDMSTDAGDLSLQNLRGNSLARYIAKSLRAHEFEGALCTLRFADPLTQIEFDRFDGYLSDQDGDTEQFTFRLLQLMDPQQYDVASDLFNETCTLRFKEGRCGSTGSNTICTKKLLVVSPGPNDCTAVERFTGAPNPAPFAIYPPNVPEPWTEPDQIAKKPWINNDVTNGHIGRDTIGSGLMP